MPLSVGATLGLYEIVAEGPKLKRGYSVVVVPNI